MFDIKQFVSAMHQIAEEKSIQESKVLETIEMALAAAYKKDYGDKSQIVRATLNPETADVVFTRMHIVVDGVDEEEYLTGELPEQIHLHERRGKDEEQEEIRIKFNEQKHILLKDAKKGSKVGDEIVTKLETKTEFGRIAAQTAKQVILQRLREIEREGILVEFRDKVEEVVSGIIQRVEGRVIYIDLGRTNGVLPPSEQIPREHYRIGQRLKLFIVRVEEGNRGPAVILSRAHPKLVVRLFEFEVPEIENESVEIKAIAREPGSRSKVAVTSNDDTIDPIGSLVGQKGIRVQTVINELGGEKIDIIEWSDDPAKFIAKSLSPAKVLEVKLVDQEKMQALVEVANDQFPLAIGKQGQNVRLAAKLTGWKIDVRSPQGEISSEEEINQPLPNAVVGEEKKDMENDKY